MPDMETLYHRFGRKGLVILAISDEERAKVETFLVQHKYSYPILLDPRHEGERAVRDRGHSQHFPLRPRRRAGGNGHRPSHRVPVSRAPENGQTGVKILAFGTNWLIVPAFSRSSEETAGLIPGAQIHLFERETHMLPIEKSDKVAGAIADFLD
jgi:pimeloyl-ACP methyl ester carboxylesterase